MLAFWDGWLAWSREQGIDYHIGRTLAPRLAALGLEQVAGTAETAVYNGGSPWAAYWIDTVTELRPRLVGSGKLDDRLVDRLPRPVRRPGLVDPDHRLHRRPCPRAQGALSSGVQWGVSITSHSSSGRVAKDEQRSSPAPCPPPPPAPSGSARPRDS